MSKNKEKCSIFPLIFFTLLLGFIIGLALSTTYTYEKGYIKPLLVEEKCGYYDSTTGDYVIKNLLRKE